MTALIDDIELLAMNSVAYSGQVRYTEFALCFLHDNNHNNTQTFSSQNAEITKQGAKVRRRLFAFRFLFFFLNDV